MDERVGAGDSGGERVGMGGGFQIISAHFPPPPPTLSFFPPSSYPHLPSPYSGKSQKFSSSSSPLELLSRLQTPRMIHAFIPFSAASAVPRMRRSGQDKD